MRKRVWSLVSLGRYSVRFITEMMGRRWRGATPPNLMYEEIGIPVSCLTTPGCHLAEFSDKSAMGKHVRYKPGWPCEKVLRARKLCWTELWQ